jgi:putative ABC transport system permease protein
LAALLGSLVYRLAIALALSLKLGNFSFTPSDLNLLTALLVVFALTLPGLRRKVFRR